MKWNEWNRMSGYEWIDMNRINEWIWMDMNIMNNTMIEWMNDWIEWKRINEWMYDAWMYITSECNEYVMSEWIIDCRKHLYMQWIGRRPKQIRWIGHRSFFHHLSDWGSSSDSRDLGLRGIGPRKTSNPGSHIAMYALITETGTINWIHATWINKCWD